MSAFLHLNPMSPAIGADPQAAPGVPMQAPCPCGSSHGGQFTSDGYLIAAFDPCGAPPLTGGTG